MGLTINDRPAHHPRLSPIAEQNAGGEGAVKVERPQRSEDERHVTSDPAGVLQAPLTVLAAAHQLVDRALADDDLDLARMAADIGYRVDPAEDQPLCDLLRISHRAGNDLDARSWAQLLLQTNGVESPEDLPNLDTSP